MQARETRTSEETGHRPDAGSGTGYGWFIAASGTWVGANGIQGVIVAYLLTIELGVRAEALGLAQTLGLLPGLAFLLIGGAAADRREPRRLLMSLHFACVVPMLVLAGLVSADALTYAAMIGFILAMGTIGAFSVPVREAHLSHVAGPNLLRAVTGVMIVQSAAQAVGAFAAGEAIRSFGSVAVLVFQGALLASGALLLLGIPRVAAAHGGAQAPSALHQIAEGVRVVIRDPQLRAPIYLMLSVGTCFMGPFLVVFPLLVRDVYGGGEREMGMLLATFPIGTICGSLVLRVQGTARKGRACLIALATGAVLLGSIGFGVPFWGTLVLTLGWGISGAFFLNCSRALFQAAAPVAQRARAMSVFQLAFTAAAPAGSLLAGFLAGQIGPLPTLWIYSSAMLVIVAGIWTFTNTADMT